MAKVEFDVIPGAIRNPGVYSEYNTKGAVSTLPNNPISVLIVAPASVSMTTPFSSPAKIFSDVEAGTLFGNGSMAHLMARQAILNNPNINLTVIGLKDHTQGVAAVGKASLTGTATTDGTAAITLSGNVYQTRVTKGEADTAIIARLVAIANADPLCPVIASVENTRNFKGVVKSKGEFGNEFHIAMSCTAEGLRTAITGFGSGASNAEIATALTSVAGEHFNVIVSPFSNTAAATALRTHLETVSSPTEKKPAIGVLGFKGTMASGTTFTSAINSERITVAWYKGATEPNGVLAAGFAAVIAGEEDPARPLNSLEVKGLREVDSTQAPTFSEFNQALYNGLSPLEVVNHRVQIKRAITTYTRSASNVDDPSLLDLTTIRTLDYVRYAVEQRIALRFPRSKLNDRIAKKVRSEILDVLLRLEEAEVIEHVKEHKAKLQVVRSNVDVNRLDCVIPADVVNGLHVVANRIDLIL